MRRFAVLVLTAAFCVPETALAHPGDALHGIAAGFEHPFGGADHLLAMFAVGLLAVQLGGRALCLVPAAFVFTMIAGSLTGLAGMKLPGTEYAIAISIVAIALPVAFALGMPLAPAMAYVAIFAFFHGHAHGAELPAGGNAALYILGFSCATVLIHALGIAVGLATGRLAGQLHKPALRIAGIFVALAGLTVFVT